jgi:mRNA deadenylase 3'-5' endonuclease subunit Ccr4
MACEALEKKGPGQSRRFFSCLRLACGAIICREVDELFSAASYNVLASAYIERAWYPRTPALLLDPSWRIPALVQHVVKLRADLICLQEVEPLSFAALRATLAGNGYGGRFSPKQGGRPEGVAIFYRENKFVFIDARVLAFTDGAGVKADSGYIALIARLASSAGVLGIMNTHLSWDRPDTAPAAQIGRRQAEQLIAEYCYGAAGAKGWVIAGDFNTTPESEIIAAFERTGLQYAHRGMTDVFTCNVGAKGRMIDYLFYSSGLAAQPIPPTKIDSKTVLPSVEEPSDHVAIMAQFTWQN